jgi:putative DNA primase/helicase
MYRFIEKEHPTLILDEADSVFKINEDLRTLFNASFTRATASALRCVGNDFEPRRFNTWAPKAIGLIGNLPDTLDSRSIVVPMRRKLPEEKIESLRADRDHGFSDLKRMMLRWTTDHCEKIAQQDPRIPSGLSDRQADCWRELMRIADEAGGIWPVKVRKATLSVVSNITEYLDYKIAILSDIRSIFATFPEKNRWTAANLVFQLIEDESKPWIEWNRGQPLTASNLARLLKPFGIKTTDAKESGKTLKCYKISDFEGVFARYLHNPPQPATKSNNLMFNSDLQNPPKVADYFHFRNRNFSATGVNLDSIKKSPISCAEIHDSLVFDKTQNDYVAEIN